MPGFRGNGNYDGSFVQDANLLSFGNGRDGIYIVTGSITLNQDMYFDTLTVNSGSVINTNSYRLFVKNTLWVKYGGLIHNSGSNSLGTAGGAAITANSLGGSAAGGAGGAPSSNGAAGGNISYSFAGAGRTGGAGAGGVGGDGGFNQKTADFQLSYPPFNAGALRFYPLNTLGALFSIGNQIFLSGGTGGGGGGGNIAGGSGGGGGGGGGVMVLSARHIINEGIITVNGGNGADGQATNAGGGGGGGGGMLLLNNNSLTTGLYGTISAQGGLGGNATGTGVTGSDGLSGVVFSSNLNLVPLSFYSIFGWYRSDTGVVTSSNGTVQQWNDLSGWGRHMSQSNTSFQPQLITNSLNGYPSIKFDGVNDYLQTNSISRYFESLAYFMVIKINNVGSAGNNDVIFSGVSSSLIAFADTTPRTGYTKAGTTATTGSILASGSFAAITWVMTSLKDAGSANIRYNNKTFVAVSSPPSASIPLGITLGGMPDGTRCSGFDICELIVFSRKNTNNWSAGVNERQLLEFYFGAKYGFVY